MGPQDGCSRATDLLVAPAPTAADRYYIPLVSMPLKGGESRKMDRSKLPLPLPEHELTLADGEEALEMEEAETPRTKGPCFPTVGCQWTPVKLYCAPSL